MLAVNSDRYKIPIRRKTDNGNPIWRLNVRDGSLNGVMYASNFSYTFVEGPFKASFTYNGASVKPSPRTLRVYGADALKDFVSRLSTNDSPEDWFCLGDLARESKLQIHSDFEDWSLTEDGVDSSWWN